MNSIVVENLTKKFGDRVAVDNVTFNIKKGEVFGLLGPNGAGKTTIISMLTTLLRPTSGRALVDGYDVLKESFKVRKSIGLVFQETILDEDLKAYDNLLTHASLYNVPREEIKERINELLNLVGLGAEIKTRVGKFSGGMKRRLEIARGLIHHPKVLFLDEPTIGLDPKTRHLIWDYIRKLNEKTDVTILLTTHYLEEADFLCDRVAIINEAEIVAMDTPENLKHSLGGDLIKVQLDRRDPKLEKELKKLSFVEKMNIRENTISITVQCGEEHVVEIIMLIDKFPSVIKSLNLREPTLDDVFLYHTGEKFNNQQN
ncbi:MAG: hypothetical protein ACD_63C00070G0003 [uncultured bacterium]|nr:MAG: hypothetical protein ACD_63C00070G0003 [uncultured bacterium]